MHLTLVSDRPDHAPSRTPAADGFRWLNSTLEPWVRAGCASPTVAPGLIVLETTGRRTGSTHRTPLLATIGTSGNLWVTTVRAADSDWLRNARANSSVRYWLYGQPHEGRAIVFAPAEPLPDLGELSPLSRMAATSLAALAGPLGIAFAIVVPEVQPVRLIRKQI